MVLTLCNKVYLCYVTHFNMHELETLLHSFIQVQIRVISPGRLRHLRWQMSLVLLLLLLPLATHLFHILPYIRF